MPLDNHVNLSLHTISERDDAYVFRLATEDDIPFLMKEDEYYREFYALSSFRDKAHWKYLLTESLKTEYGSEYWILESKDRSKKFYCRIPEHGFGEGLIISEISENMSIDAAQSLFAFCKDKAIERSKPYIRLNLHNDSVAAKLAIAMGVKEGNPYAWQIKTPDTIRLLKRMSPVFEKRIRESSFRGFSGKIRLDFYKRKVDLLWENGELKSVSAGEGECAYSFSINADLYPVLVLGHRSWQELRYSRPDIFPNSDYSALFMETLFPPLRSWIHEQY